MKKHLILLLAAISTSFVACDYDDVIEPLNYGAFEVNTTSFSVDEDGSASYEVTVYTSNTTGSDRTIALSAAASSTLAADSYDLPATVTIPANSNSGTFTLGLTDNSIDRCGETLVLNLGNETVDAGNPLSINIINVFPYETAGVYNNASEFYEAEFPVEIVAGSTANEFIAKDLFAVGTDITFTVNADNSITVPYQDAWVSGTYGQASVEGTGTLVKCTGTLTLSVEHTVAAGSFGTYDEVMTKVTGEEPEGEEPEEEETEEEETEGEA